MDKVGRAHGGLKEASCPAWEEGSLATARGANMRLAVRDAVRAPVRGSRYVLCILCSRSID